MYNLKNILQFPIIATCCWQVSLSLSIEKEANLPFFDARFDTLPAQCALRTTPISCAEATACTKLSGLYYIKLPHMDNQVFLMECDATTAGGDWTVIQRRQDGSEYFYLPWADYKIGFGNIDYEYFIGLDKLYTLTNFYGRQELLIQMELNATSSAYAHYDSFQIGPEEEKYMLNLVGSYTGTAGDSLTFHVGSKFSTKDQDNDKSSVRDCALESGGAWWYMGCYYR